MGFIFQKKKYSYKDFTTEMSICIKNFYFPIKLLKSGFVANVK